MSAPAVLDAAADGVASLTMNRPQVLNARNARNDERLAGASASFAQAFTRIGRVPEALAGALRLARTPARAYDLVAPAFEHSASHGRGALLEAEGRLQAQAMAGDDHKQGVAAFLARRPATFKGS